MNILWITNITFPEAIKLYKGEGKLISSGGWMLASANALLDTNEDIKLYIASLSPDVNEIKELKGGRITYFLLPYGSGNKKPNREYDVFWKDIHVRVKPDVVHIHGTEFSHGQSYIKACGSHNVVISIQGLTSAYFYYHYGISDKDIRKNMTMSDIIHGTSLFKLQQAQKKRSAYEIDMIQAVSHIIGRTSWDKARVWAINPHAEYHFCNESLREEFYDGKWAFETCKEHSIFLSQAGTPIKGLQQLLKAMPLVLRHYPDAIIRIGGWNPAKADSLSQKLRLSGYGHYLKSQIQKLNLAEKVFFLGNLDADEMKAEYLNANVFVMPSAIENSPNSLGEAQLLGVPIVASYVGGTHDMVPEPSCGDLYRFEEVEMLAYKICQAFEKSSMFDNTMMREIARNRHDCRINAETLLGIYKTINDEKL